MYTSQYFRWIEKVLKLTGGWLQGDSRTWSFSPLSHPSSSPQGQRPSSSGGRKRGGVDEVRLGIKEEGMGGQFFFSFFFAALAAFAGFIHGCGTPVSASSAPHLPPWEGGRGGGAAGGWAPGRGVVRSLSAGLSSRSRRGPAAHQWCLCCSSGGHLLAGSESRSTLGMELSSPRYQDWKTETQDKKG